MGTRRHSTKKGECGGRDVGLRGEEGPKEDSKLKSREKCGVSPSYTQYWIQFFGRFWDRSREMYKFNLEAEHVSGSHSPDRCPTVQKCKAAFSSFSGERFEWSKVKPELSAERY